MMVVELTFGPEEQRLAARPEHRQLLADLHAEGRVLAAGPWPGDTGAMLVFRADRAELEAIMAADPYYTTPGVTVTSIREWEPVIGAV